MEYAKELGLTESEGKAYEVLVKHGKLGSGEISRESGVSYSKIYNILDSLTNKGLVKVIPEKTKKFAPADPEQLIKLIDEKQEKLREAMSKAKEMKQFYDVKEKNPVVMEMGKKGFHKILKDLKAPKKHSYAIKWSSEYRPEWAGKAERNLKKGVDVKVLARYDDETKKDVKKWMKINKNIKEFDNSGVAFSIGDEETMISLIKSNVTLLIRDKAFVEVMRKMFLETYKNAEKVK
jgi:sugar-specific transcriptional regulator TrmB